MEVFMIQVQTLLLLYLCLVFTVIAVGVFRAQYLLSKFADRWFKMREHDVHRNQPEFPFNQRSAGDKTEWNAELD
jgi:hypothetical protein